MEITDDNVVEQLRQRNQKAIEYIVDVYGGLIKSVVYRHMRGFEAYSDECVNDVLFSVWNNIDKFDPEKNSLKNWIGALSKYKSIDYKRKYFRDLEQNELDENTASTDSPETQVLKSELDSEVTSMLEFLKPRDRRLFLDHYIKGKDIDELSADYGMKESVIYNRLSRGRKKIRDCVNFSRGENNAR